MRRARLGLVLLAVLLAAALTVTWGMEKLHAPIAQDLERAAEAVLRGDLPLGTALADRAAAEWEKWARLRGCFCDHGPAEEADASFAALKVYAARGEESDFAAGCAELARKVRAMSDAHAISPESLL